MSFAETLAQVGRNELEFWMAGDHRECLPALPEGDPRKHVGQLRVARYWNEGLGINGLDGCSAQSWSGAFICWSLRQTGMPLVDFPFSAGHHTYIRWAINNSKQNKPGKSYYGRRLTEYRPRPGDLIAQWRKVHATDPDPNVSFDVQPDAFYSAHCDIVLRADANQIIAVGGNVSDRVRTTTFIAQDGFLTFKKELICVMECRQGSPLVATRPRTVFAG